MQRMKTDALIGRGWRFPINVDARGRLQWSQGPDRIRDSIWIIVRTIAGERVMRPRFGASTDDYVFQSNSPATRAALQSAIKDALVQWEPRIEVVSVRVNTASSDPEHRLRDTGLDNQVLVTIDYQIRATNELFNVVYPLYLDEGVS
jgi:phage baseplate assembly protein W